MLATISPLCLETIVDQCLLRGIIAIMPLVSETMMIIDECRHLVVIGMGLCPRLTIEEVAILSPHTADIRHHHLPMAMIGTIAVLAKGMPHMGPRLCLGEDHVRHRVLCIGMSTLLGLLLVLWSFCLLRSQALLLVRAPDFPPDYRGRSSPAQSGPPGRYVPNYTRDISREAEPRYKYAALLPGYFC